MTTSRALIPLTRPQPPAMRKPLPLVATQRLLPLASRTVAAAAVGLVTEYMLRAVANRALRSALQATARPSDVTRTIVTELVIVERGRRRLL